MNYECTCKGYVTPGPHPMCPGCLASFHQALSRTRSELLIKHHICECCGRQDKDHWDGIYSSCSACAFCSSLEHYECHHGECK